MPSESVVRPLRVDFSEVELAELRRRVNATRWPERETVADDSQGVRLALMQDLARYWGTEHGATGWLNSPPLTPAGLRGKVVLVDFWTYTCINWLRQLPYLRAWAEKYSGQSRRSCPIRTARR